MEHDGTPRAEDRYRDLRDHYRLLIENTADVVVRTLEGVLVWVSPAIEDLAGWTPSELQGRTTAHLWHPEDLDTAIRQRDETYSGRPSRGTLRLRRKDGDYVWVDAALKPYRQPDGRLGAVGSLRDVTAQVQAHRAAEVEHARLQAMFTSMIEPHMMLEGLRDKSGLPVDFTVVDINPTAARPFQHSAEDMRGKRLSALVSPAVWPQVRDTLTAWLASGDPVSLSDWTFEIAGTRRYYDLHVSMSGDVLMVAWRDVTDRHEDAARLLASETAYRVLSENAADLILRLDAEEQVVWASPASHRLLGYLPEELLGPARWEMIHPQDRAAYRQALQSLRAGSRCAVTAEVRLRHRHGPFGWWSASARRTTDDPTTSEVVVALTNIDAEKRARVRLEQEQARRAAAIESMLDPHVLLRALTDEQGRITDFVYADANAAACAYMGMSRAELLGSSVMSLLPAHGSSGLLDRYIHTLTTGQPLILDNFEYPHEIVAAARRFDIRGVKVDDAISFTWRDVTDRHAVTEQLAASERRYRLLAENSLDVIAQLTMSGTIQWVSPSVTAVLGWQPDELVGTPNIDLVHVADRDWVVERLGEVIAAEQPSRITMRMRHRDGHYVWMEAVGQQATSDDADEAVRVVRLRDVEAEHREQARLRAAVDGVVDPLVLLTPVLDSDGQICDFVFQEVNSATCEYLTLTRDDLIGQRLLTLLPNLADAGLFDLYVQAFHATEAFTVDDVLYDNEVLGMARRYDIRATSTPTQLVLTWRDVTTRHAQAEALARAEEQARRLAEIDTLTGLLNRREVFARLSAILSHPPRTGQRVAVAFADLDGLKTINDTLGHAAGDELLRAVAERFRTTVRAEDIVARIGGDELLLVLPGVHTLDEAIRVTDSLRELVDGPVASDLGHLHSTVSIGVTLTHDDDTADSVIARADAAMYKAKTTGNRVVGIA